MARRKRKGGPNLMTEALRSQSTCSDSNGKRKMSSRRGNYSGGSSSKGTGSAILPYNAVASRRRFRRRGFHENVSNNSIQTEIDLWSATRNESNQYRNGQLPSFGKYVDAKALVKPVDVSILQEHQIQYPLRGVFAGLHIFGQIVAEDLAAAGITNLVNFAKAYPEGWGALSQGMAVFDVSIRAFRGLPSGRVFIAVTPKVSYEEFMHNPDFDQDQEHRATRNAVNLICTIHRECGPSAPFWTMEPLTADMILTQDRLLDQELESLKKANLREMNEDERDEYIRTVQARAGHMWHERVHGRKLVKMVRSLPHVQDLAGRVAALTEPSPTQDYVMSRQVGLSTTFTTLIGIYNRRQTIRVLHFHGTPMLDRRLVAVVARACPNLKMLGIYDCPDIHFGDAVCLLDLIHEINSSRSSNQPRIEAFDFYPRYNTGSLLSEAKPGADANAYGLSSQKLLLDAQQRGVFGILLQVVLKSKEMNLQLLMDRNGAFMTYLSKLPFVPLQIFGYLDGLYRYLDLMAAGSKDDNAIKQALYDIVKPVRMGLESLDKDWHEYYLNEMGKNTMFCSSCGHEALIEFFGQETRTAREHTHLCAACNLRMWLDEERDQGKRDGTEIMKPFFPKWERFDFNQDAPLYEHGKGLITLKSTGTERPLPPAAQFDANGNVINHHYIEPLLRDNKIHDDSLQRLPDLRDMFDQELLKDAQYRARIIDARNTAHVLLKDCYPPDTLRSQAYENRTPDLEGQGRARTQHDMCLVSHSFDDAAVFFDDLQHKTFAELKAYRYSTPGNPGGFW
ncbi:uncharacterized protein NECHADRAFT_75284 [Fusarium vanettenii 77-13-4]|uniref:Uncharacterized protein n=1 Tax=Fusarium vanettenii (strain ATCC MYA-4622 / CBS 123669 / FGSC 9596 / NRRL 45880 / 77-13-4) TaxID=660122 RepID=C7YID8_FUSV7|nr:uncharacterized protein NECHADRAFT_75284 [Fusarium vanettenii 77-13-4]EEU48786.1 hypothetical protein NECHADRAFT_75284 [Fusarium vanettenii 77-13-4]